MLVFQIVIALVVLVGLITIIMSIKNWHWAQMLLLLAIFFSGIGTLILGLEVFRIHRTYRQGIPDLERQVADVQAEIDALRRGARDETLAARVFAPDEIPFDYAAEGRMPGTGVWSKRLQGMARQRGRVWRGVGPAAAFDPRTGRVQVAIAQPKPHGLEKNGTVFAFEQGEPTAATPDKGPQYLGEFRVVETNADGAILELVTKLDPVPGTLPPWFTQLNAMAPTRIGRSRGPWSLYETMPADSHELFAGATDEQLKQWLPAASAPEYIRHGEPATDDDDEFHRALYDEQDHRLGPEDADKAVKSLYDRPLRDYAYLFAELLRQRVVMMAEHSGLTEDIAKLTAAEASAQKLKAHRTAELQGLTGDLKHLQRDRQVIEKLRDAILAQLAEARRRTAAYLAEASQKAAELAQRQLSQLEAINAATPAPPSPLAAQ